MEILPGVYWLQAGYANIYLCVEDEGLTLIDSGLPGQASKIADMIRALGYDAGRLRRIVITHADVDHAGSAAALHRMTGAIVVAGPATVGYLQQGRASSHIKGPLGLLGNPLNRYRAVPPEALVAVDSGSDVPVLGGLRALATPGHTLDHHVFYSASRGILFCGDALSVHGDQLAMPPAFITADLMAAKQSARVLLELEPAVFACGHGEPMAGARAKDAHALWQTIGEG